MKNLGGWGRLPAVGSHSVLHTLPAVVNPQSSEKEATYWNKSPCLRTRTEGRPPTQPHRGSRVQPWQSWWRWARTGPSRRDARRAWCASLPAEEAEGGSCFLLGPCQEMGARQGCLYPQLSLPVINQNYPLRSATRCVSDHRAARAEQVLASGNLSWILLLLWNLGEVLPEPLLYGFLLQFSEIKYLETFTMWMWKMLLLQWDPTPLRDPGKPLESSKVKLGSAQIWGQICFINLSSLKIGHPQIACAFIIDQNIKLTRTSFPSYWLKRIYCSWKRTCENTIYHHIFFFHLRERQRQRETQAEKEWLRDFLPGEDQQLTTTGRS